MLTFEIFQNYFQSYFINYYQGGSGARQKTQKETPDSLVELV